MVFESTINLIDAFKVFITAVLIFVIVYAMLKKIKIFGEGNSINSIVALISAIIVSFSGVVTYAVSYAVNWFVIILFIIFLIMVILMFLGVKADDISSGINSNKKIVIGVLVVLFLFILLKSFFGLNNVFDLNEPQEDPYLVDTDFNTGVDDITDKEINPDYESSDIDYGLVSVFVFLLILGLAVMFMGK